MREERNLYPLLTEMGERRVSRVKSRFFETEPGTKTNSPPAVGHMEGDFPRSTLVKVLYMPMKWDLRWEAVNMEVYKGGNLP